MTSSWSGLLRKILEAEDDITVLAEAGNGLEAIAAARRHQSDVVLMDIRMPDLDGLEATRRLLREDPALTRVLILTTFDLDCHVETLEERDAGLRVRCSSGAAFEAGVVVGADGVHSLVRDWVTGGDEPVYSGTSAFRGLVPVERLPRLPDPGALQFWMGSGAHLLHYPISDGSVINFLAVIDTPERWAAPAWMVDAEPGAHLKAFAGWHPAVTEMIGAVPQSPRWGLFARRPLACWSRGPAVLLGDAAHAMLPHQGQGANQTIEDAVVLAAELDSASDVPAALRRYADRRRVRTRQVQLLSWAASAALHLPDGPATRRRDAYLAQLPRHLAWIHGYDALAQARGDLAQNPEG